MGSVTITNQNGKKTTEKFVGTAIPFVLQRKGNLGKADGLSFSEFKLLTPLRQAELMRTCHWEKHNTKKVGKYADLVKRVIKEATAEFVMRIGKTKETGSWDWPNYEYVELADHANKNGIQTAWYHYAKEFADATVDLNLPRRREIMRAIYFLDSPESLNFARSACLTDFDPEVKVMAIGKIGGSGGKKDISLLELVVSINENHSVEKAAATAIAELKAKMQS